MNYQKLMSVKSYHKKKEGEEALSDIIKESNEPVADNIKIIIKEKCMKQSLIAERAGYKPCEFNAMLNGRKIMKVKDISAIIKILGIEANEIFKKEGETG